MRPTILPNLFLLAAFYVSASTAAADSDNHPLREVPLIGSPCEGCDAAFDGVPDQNPSRLFLARPDESGEPMTLQGRVIDPSGQARAGVILYVHQTNHEGRYPEHDAPGNLGREARRHGRLRGWVRSDAEGRYAIDTLRPGSYPDSNIPQHIHMQVIEPGCFTYLIDDVLFTDDPKLSRAYRDRFDRGMGGTGVVTPTKVDGRWRAERLVRLGANIPGYRPCASRSR
ncbi:dioxygenase family protein [Tahibacter harae]|uniref:Intradiol ring-cleavage dioxygenases domain-containing protein n=1 Tax=Tahibacter harae TaxID=2963937 RepID=A0ABT1QZI6_9GAMM|nr:hypothetical protein [Tahibacter harae]MCQ4167708.1 hypothetical protein [Tahibacter harae]